MGQKGKGETVNIGLIGPGEIGGVIVRKLRNAGYPVKMANSKGPDSLSKLAAETGAKAVSIEQVVQDVDVLFIAIPQKAIPKLPKGLLNEAKKETTVIDVGNYYPFRDDRIDEIENGLTDSAWVEKQIGRPVIKALNSIVSNSLEEAGRPAGSRDRVALAISGDNPKAKEVVAKLIDRMGFDSVDAGTIAESWRQQPGSPVYCTNPTKEELQKWLKNVDRSSLATKREKGMKAHFAVEHRDPRTGTLIKRTDYQTIVNAHRSVHPEMMNSK
jgi:predicted dinucleotide-binding enzyme